jgi:hypothetical protein
MVELTLERNTFLVYRQTVVPRAHQQRADVDFHEMSSVMNGRVDTSAWRVATRMQFPVTYYQQYRYLD